MTIKQFLLGTLGTFWTAVVCGIGFSFGVLIFFAILA